MKTKVFLTSIILIGVMPVSMTFGQTAIQFGASYWNAVSEYNDDNFEDIDIGSANMYGPEVNLRLGRVAFGSTLYFGKVEWSNTVRDFDLSANRNDMNFTLGLKLSPRFTLFGAVKSISLKGNQTFDNGDYEIENTGTLYGAGLSGVFDFRRRSPFFITWTATYLFGKMDLVSTLSIDGLPDEEFENDYDVEQTALTVGLGYRFSSGFNLIVGYKADMNGETDGEERIHGIFVTLSYMLHSRY